MKAVTWHGKRDVRVDSVPDPSIEQPTDAIVRDHLDLYLRLRPPPVRGARGVHRRGRHPRSRADGHRGGSGERRPEHHARRPRRDPVQHLLRQLLDVRPQALLTMRDHPGPRPGQGRGAVRLHQALRPGAGRAGRAPARTPGPLRADQGAGGTARRALCLPERRAADCLAGGRVRGDPRGRVGRGVRPGTDRADVLPDRPAARRRPGDRSRSRGGAPRDGAPPRSSGRSIDSEVGDLARGHSGADRRARHRLRYRRGGHGGPRCSAGQARPGCRGPAARCGRAADDRAGRRSTACRRSTTASTRCAAAARSRSAASTAARRTRCR